MNRLGVGVIGAGYMGARHADVYTGMSDVEVKAICDVRAESAGALATRLGVASYTDFNELLARDDIQAVSVCTSDDAHREPCVQAARSGKHVLVEKPVATNVEDAAAIIAAAKDAGVVLLVGHCLRFDPRYCQAQATIANGALGEVQTIYTRRANTVAAQDRLKGRCSLPMFLGVHDYDVMRWMLASEAQRVTAVSKWGLLQAEGFDVEDANCAVFEFANGALGIAELNWILPRGFFAGADMRADVVGSKGALNVASLETGLRVADEQRTMLVDTAAAPSVRGHIGGMFAFELQHFVDCVTRGVQPALSADDALAAVRMALAVEQAAASGAPVTL